MSLPPAALFFVPISLLSPATAVPVWTILNLLLAIGATLWVASVALQITRGRGAPPNRPPLPKGEGGGEGLPSQPVSWFDKLTTSGSGDSITTGSEGPTTSGSDEPTMSDSEELTVIGSDGPAMRRSGREAMVATFWLAFAFVPLVWGVLIGQSVGFSVLLYSVAFVAFWRRADGLGAVMLAFMAILKPQLTVGAVVFLLAQRRWRGLAVLAICGAILAVVSVLLVGLDGLAEYSRLLRQMDSFFGDPTLGLLTWLMVNWRSWIARIPGITETTGMALTLGASFAGLGLVAFRWRRPVSGDLAFVRAFLCFTAAGLIASFHSTYQDLVVLLPPATAALWLELRVLPRLGGRWSPRGIWLLAERSLADFRPWPHLALVAGALLFAVPALAWALVGPSALFRAGIWSALGLPALLILIAATMPGGARARQP